MPRATRPAFAILRFDELDGVLAHENVTVKPLAP